MPVRGVGLGALVLALVVTGCATRKPTVPVEDRGSMSRGPATAGGGEAARGQSTPTDSEATPGFYTVRPGDSMLRIGAQTRISWRDIARWNNVDNPDRIEVGQVLRLTPPSVAAGSTPVPPRAAATASTGSTAPAAASGSVAGTEVANDTAVAIARPSDTRSPADKANQADKVGSADKNDGAINWVWPAEGSLVARFDPSKNKGLDIAGKSGDSVVAAADGKVVYAGALRGYGNLIIIQHTPPFLSIYGHNKTLLVKDKQAVQKGQKIAEMGASDATRVKLHFEIRRAAEPVDPARYLPPR